MHNFFYLYFKNIEKKNIEKVFMFKFIMVKKHQTHDEAQVK